MKTNEITEGNQLIAEFMGITDDKGWYDGFLIDKAGLPFSCGAMGNGTRKLNFNSSWDWLMPVVEKIESINDNEGDFDCHFEIMRDGCFVIAWHGETLIETYKETKIEAVWYAVIEFIKWYNENK